MPTTLSASTYHALAANRKYTWGGSSVPKRSNMLTLWRCGHGHEFSYSYQQLKSGRTCLQCNPPKPLKTEQDYRKLAAENGLEWTGTTVPQTAAIPTTWLCAQGHSLTRCYSKIKSGYNKCRLCGAKKPKIEADYHELAATRGYKWIGVKLPKDILHKTQWLCPNGHSWSATFQCMREGRSCFYCCSRSPKTETDYVNMACAHGLTWVGPELPENNKDKTTWSCVSGHHFSLAYATLRQKDKGAFLCPTCAEERNYRELGAKKGLHWIGNEVPPDKYTKTLWACPENHQVFTSFECLRHYVGCSQCSHRARKTKDDYLALAEKKGLKWVGTNLPGNVLETTNWQCLAGHNFASTYGQVYSGDHCPVCAHNMAAERKIERQSQKARLYNELASSHELRWIGAEVPNQFSDSTRWSCSCGKEIKASYSRIARRGNPCDHFVLQQEPVLSTVF